MRVLAIICLCALLVACNRPAELRQPAETVAETASKEDRYQKDLDEVKKAMRSEVKIKLKKDGKGTYSWEIQGKDAGEVLKANDTLKKKLGE